MLRDVIKAVSRLSREVHIADPDCYNSRYAPSVQYPNVYGDWMDAHVPPGAWDVFIEHCEKAATIDELRSFPTVTEPKNAETVIITASVDVTEMKEKAKLVDTNPKRPSSLVVENSTSSDRPKLERICYDFSNTGTCSRAVCKFKHVRRAAPAGTRKGAAGRGK
jgi:hypothetical protein